MHFTVGTFNLRNLALPNIQVYKDLMYSPQEYEAKIMWSMTQLTKLDADIVAFQEAFHDEALEELISRAGYKPSQLIISKTDQLEPKVGLLSRFPIKSQRCLSTLPKECQTEEFQHFRRPLIHAEIELSTEQSLHIFAIHLKSKQPLMSPDANPLDSISISKGISKSLQLRALEATAIRSFILDVLPDPVIVLGDFNDISQSVTTQIICGPKAPYQSSPLQRHQFIQERLFPVCDAAALKRYTNAHYTYAYNGWHENIDQILLSNHFADNNPRAIGRLHYTHVFNDHLIDHSFYNVDMPKHISDHGQLMAKINLLNAEQQKSSNSI
ncbi:MAG: hypothetical protein CMK59_00615 [Proteobacteria bacterium]|nr:hypothetical protein [Pseudomonadota bacterium]